MTSAITFADIRRNTKKPENIWFRIFYFLSSFVVWIAIRVGLTPNQLTLTSFVLNVSAALFFLLTPIAPEMILIAAAVFTLAHIFDCADGHLAFVTGQRSEVGYWLDSALDIFKSGFLTCCFCRLVILGDLPGAGHTPAWIRNTAICAAMGVIINYAVGLHAGRYKDRVDGYKTDSFSLAGIPALSNRFLRFVISHVREYGNLLVIFALFALNTRVATTLFAVVGTSHLLLALHRVYRTSQLIR